MTGKLSTEVVPGSETPGDPNPPYPDEVEGPDTDQRHRQGQGSWTSPEEASQREGETELMKLEPAPRPLNWELDKMGLALYKLDEVTLVLLSFSTAK